MLPSVGGVHVAPVLLDGSKGARRLAPRIQALVFEVGLAGLLLPASCRCHPDSFWGDHHGGGLVREGSWKRLDS